MRWLRRTRVALLATLPAVGLGPGAAAEWLLWPSPYEGSEVIDQQQLHEDSAQSAGDASGHGVGQTFIPRKTPLVRMDFKVINRRDQRPGRVSLWKWAGSYESTVSQPPLFTDAVGLAGGPGWQIQSFFPRIDVEPGAPYFVEFSAPNRPGFGVRANGDGIDHYPDGRIRFGDRFQTQVRNQDLWFRTYSRSAGPPQAPRFKASDPDLPWAEPEPSDGAVSKQDYYDRVKQYADMIRRPATQDCRTACHRDAIFDAFLYRVSCERDSCVESYAWSVVAMLRRAHAWRFCTPPFRPGSRSCDPDRPVFAGSLRRPAVAYLWIRGSPSLSAEDHAMIRELVLDAARRGWSRRSLGSQNQALSAALGYLLAVTLFPDVPEADAWQAYAYEAWNDFWLHKDTEEDSGGYTDIVWWPAVLQFAAIAGLDDEVWGDADFRSLVDRYFEQTAPVGARPDYGDSAGWARELSGLIWLFEKAAARSGEPRYRWLAHRIFDYNRTHARDDPPRRESFYASLPYLAWAYLDADDALPAAPPPAQRERAAASQRRIDSASWRMEKGHPVGQTFEAAATPLVRIDVRARNHGDGGPGTISLWKWAGAYASTVATAPLYRDRVDLRGEDGYRVHSFTPFLDVDVGSRYLMEFDREGAPFSLAGSRPEDDPYAGGAMRWNDRELPTADLWFATYTLSEGGSVLTTRVRATPRPRSEWGSPGRQHDLGPERVPDKIVLRSGYGPDDLHAVVNLLAGYRHGQAELGALVSLLDRGALLIGGTPFPYWYHQARPQDESVPLVRRFWGGSEGEPGSHATVTRFSDSRNATVVWAEWSDQNGWNVRQERRFYFVKNRFLLIRDRFTFPDAIGAAVGPVWHAADVQSVHGPNWYDLYYREPLSNVWKFRNPERYALFYFVSRPAYSVAEFEEASYLPPDGCSRNGSADQVAAECRASAPFVLYQNWTGEARPNESRWFDTLILPHGGAISPQQAAANVKVLYRDADSVALEVRVADETWILVDSPERDPIEVPGLSTDARYLILRSAPGKPDYVLGHELTRIDFGGISKGWPVRTSVEIGGSTPPARAAGATTW